jgi:endonuclease/exonuclease/phosphatase (EEP) superfamily protein YafD
MIKHQAGHRRLLEKLHLRTTALLLLAAICWPMSASVASQDGTANHCTTTGIPAGDSQREALSGTLEILSWNIQKASNSGWSEDLTALGGDIDLAFIQEASIQARIPDVIGGLLHQAFAAGYTTGELETGVMTLSSSSPSLYCAFTSWEPWLGTPKATSVTEFPLAGRAEKLLAINLHAVNFALGLEDFQQQFKALDELLAAHQGPVILAGDLNTWSSQRQAMVDEFTDKYGLGAISFSPDLRSTVFGRALDHIYVRGMRTLDARVVPVSTSDHNPLRVSLSLN